MPPRSARGHKTLVKIEHFVMKITFLGAAGGVTGANYLLEIGSKKMIIDCGLFQSGALMDDLNYQNFAFDPTEVGYAFITHAHLDHIGRLPKLYREGFRGAIYATGATRDIALYTLRDAYKIMQEESKDHRKSLLYKERDIDHVMNLFQEVHYEEELTLDPSFSVRFHDAGHILGSAIISFTSKKEGKSIVFSGDLGNDPKPILKAPTKIEAADYVIVESAYGNRVHESLRDRDALLSHIILSNIKNKGVLLIPAFSVERTQELLYFCNDLVERHHYPPIPTFLDSPLAIHITQIFKKYPEMYDQEAKELQDAGDDFLRFPGLVMTPTVRSSKMISRVQPPKMIIAGSGMMHGGRILHHLQEYLPLKQTTLLIVGFQVRGSLGRQLLEGARRIRVKGKEIPVRAEVVGLGAMSAHADANQLFAWVKDIQGLKKVFVVQGDPEAASGLAIRMRQGLTVETIVPGLGYSEIL